MAQHLGLNPSHCRFEPDRGHQERRPSPCSSSVERRLDMAEADGSAPSRGTNGRERKVAERLAFQARQSRPPPDRTAPMRCASTHAARSWTGPLGSSPVSPAITHLELRAAEASALTRVCAGSSPARCTNLSVWGSGRPPVSGTGSRKFESCRADQEGIVQWQDLSLPS